MTRPGSDLMATDGAAVAVHMLTSLSTAVAEVKAHMTKIGEEQASQRDMLTRFDERQIMWATKQEVSEGLAHLRELIAPIAQQALAAHTRIDGFDIDLTSVKQDLDDHDVDVGRRLQTQHASHATQMDKMAEELTALRLSWARATGIAAAAAVMGSASTAAMAKALGLA